MTTVFAYGWKSLAWRGIIGVSFGIVTLLWPGISLAILVLLFGVYALFDGIAAIVLGTRDRAREHSWALLLEGFAGIGLGLAIFLWTRMAAELLVVVIAFWAVATGILELFAAIRLRHELPGEVLLGFAGAASVLLGSAILFWPSAGAPMLTALLGSYALAFGGAMLLQAMRLRNMLRHGNVGHDDRDLRAKPQAGAAATPRGIPAGHPSAR
jgi:uncharacterized membrane protein HdeD (DUF308 family)